MSKKNDNKPPKKTSVVIQFRTGSTIKEKIEQLAEQENLEAADISRKIYNAGLKHIYGLDVRGNELAAAE